MRSILVVVALAGCTGLDIEHDPAPAPAQQTAAREFFDTNVAPLFDLKCTVCHATLLTYDSIIASSTLNGNFDPALAQIVTVPDQGGAHAGGQEWNAADVSVIAEWLTLEAAER
jgi:hypothetical protein